MAKINIRKMANERPESPEVKAYRQLGEIAPDYLSNYAARDKYITSRMKEGYLIEGASEEGLRELFGAEYDAAINDFAAFHGVKLC